MGDKEAFLPTKRIFWTVAVTRGIFFKGTAFCERPFALHLHQSEKDKQNVDFATSGKISGDAHANGITPSLAISMAHVKPIVQIGRLICCNWTRRKRITTHTKNYVVFQKLCKLQKNLDQRCDAK